MHSSFAAVNWCSENNVCSHNTMNSEKAKELLGAGLSNVVVASALGVSESLVSQWLSNDEFAQEVQKLKLANLTEATSRDRKWNTLEDTLLQKLEDLLPMLVNPMAVVQALKAVNGAVRRGSPKEMGVQAQSTHVHLHMPALLAAKFTVNPANQVVEVDGRSVATMPAHAVVAEMNKRKAENLLSSPVPEAPSPDEVDMERAQSRLRSLQKLEHFPIHQVL